jgi:hypothetical protein
MTIRLDHTIVPAKDKIASARGYFAQVQVNTAFPLMAAAEGWPATPWVQPWKAPAQPASS